MYIDTDLSQILPFKKKIIYFCTENIYPNYINGILYSKTGYYSPFRRLVPTCLLYLVRHTCIEKVFSAMTNWGRSVTSKWPEKRMKRHLVAKMLLFLLIENWPDYHKTGNDTRIHAHTHCAITMWFVFYSSGNQHARLITTQTGCWSLFEERGN